MQKTMVVKQNIVKNISYELGGSIFKIELEIFGYNLLANKSHKKDIGHINPLIISRVFK